MSYCRFGWDGSDVYVFGTGDHLECCGCPLDRELGGEGGGYYEASTEQEMIDHLAEHQVAGHTVPQYAFDRLAAERDGVEYRTTVEDTLDEIRRNPQMFGKSMEELADQIEEGKEQ